MAPCSPRASADAFAPGPSATAATSSPSSRAFVRSSSALGAGPSGVTSAQTQTFISDWHDLRFGEEVRDPGGVVSSNSIVSPPCFGGASVTSATVCVAVTSSHDSPRSETLSVSTGFDFAAITPFSDG